jgi:hypothetical protein
MKELKVHVFNAKEKREIPYGYWRSLPSNLLCNLSVYLLWSSIKEIGVPHARALACLAEAVTCRWGRTDGRDVLRTRASFYLLCVCCSLLHPHRLHRAHGTGESRASGTSSCCWYPARDRRAIRFLGVSSHDCSLPYDYFLYIDDERTNDYFLYSMTNERTTTSSTSMTNERTTTSSTSTTSEWLLQLQRVCTAIIRLHRLCTATPIEVTHNGR